MNTGTQARRFSLGMALVAVVVALAVSFGLALPAHADLTAQSISYLPGVTGDMSKPSYWSDKQQDPNAVLADRATIDELNQAGIDADGTMLQPLKDAREYYFGAERQKEEKDSAAADMQSEFVDKAEDENGNVLTQAEADKIIANYPTDGAAPDIASQYAIVTTHTTMRCFPTDRMLGLTPGDADDDNLYLSVLRVNEPLIVRAQSVDKKYLMCISSCLSPCWVPAKDVAICKDKAEWLAAWDIPAGQELVVTGYKVRTEQTRVTPNTANRMLYMGTVLERYDLSSPQEALEAVGTRSAYNNHVCYLPVRNDDGTYSKELALIAESDQVTEGYLPLTKANIAEVAFHSLGQMYGWGGMLEANDCSGYVRDVYKCFGLELARNTTWQMNLPVRKYDLTGLDDEHKAAAIAQMPLGTVLFWGGHEMIYLGQEDGKLYVISSLGSIGDVYGETGTVYQVKTVSINTLDMVRGNRNTWLTTLTCANIPYISNDEQGAALTDIAFYDGGITWPESSYLYTGEAIEPSVEVPGLQAGTDYSVALENNTAVGTATVTVTGEGSYSGKVSRTFEILLPSLKQAKVTAADQAFTGAALEPEPTVTLGDRTLKAGEDYEVTSYADNTQPGTATVTVEGKGVYHDSASGTFKIGRATLGDAVVTVEDQAYTGKEIKPQPTVKLGGTVLDPYTDYRVSYENNVEVGTATVTVTGKGELVGSASATFQIVQASIENASVELPDRVYTGAALEPKPRVHVGKVLLEEGVDYTVAYKDNVNAGTATATVTGEGSYSGEASATFEIAPASLAKAAVSAPNATYTGKPIKSNPQVKMGSTILEQGKDYTVSYKANVQAGTALVKVTGMGNYADSNYDTFEIAKAAQPMTVKGSSKKAKLATVKKKAVTITKAVTVKNAKGDVSYANASSKAAAKKLKVNAKTGAITVPRGTKKGAYNVQVKVTAKGNANYKAGNKTATVKVTVK